MELGQVVRVTGAPSPPHGPGEVYRIIIIYLFDKDSAH